MQCEVNGVTDSPTNPRPDAGLARWTHPGAILVPTDLSDLDRLMPFAFEQASETGARLILLHVLATAASMATDAAGMPYYDPAGALEFAAKALDPWCAEAQRQNIACDALVREGNPARQIEAAVRQFHAGRVLLGTRSRSRLGKLLIGSSPGEMRRTRCAACHHTSRDLSPERRTCLPIRCQPGSEAGSAPRVTPDGRDGTKRVADRPGFGGDA